MMEKIREAIKTIKAACEKHMGKNSCCDGCSLRMADEGCFLGMNPKLPCNWDLEDDLGVNLVDNLGRTKEVTTMSKNLIPEVCKLLGIEVGEEFKIIFNDHSDIYKFNEKELEYKDQCSGEWKYAPSSLCGLLNGDFEITKLPWKPKLGEEYWTFSGILFKNSVETTITWEVDSYEWNNAPCDFALFDKGWVYRTREEAEAALPTIAKELGVEYEL